MGGIVIILFGILGCCLTVKVGRKILSKYICHLIKKYNNYPSEQNYIFAKKTMKELNIDYNLIMGIRYRAKKNNAIVTYDMDNIYILFEGRWEEDTIKFVICHELGHIKAKHGEGESGMLFYTALLMVFMLAFNIFLYVNPTILNNYDMGIIRKVFSEIILLFFIAGFLINIFTLFKRAQKKEYEADLISAQIVGLDIAIKAINKLDDKKTLFLSTHPQNKERIKYIIENCRYDVNTLS